MLSSNNNNKDFQIDSLFLDGRTLYAISQGILNFDTLGSTQIFKVEILPGEESNAGSSNVHQLQ